MCLHKWCFGFAHCGYMRKNKRLCSERSSSMYAACATALSPALSRSVISRIKANSRRCFRSVGSASVLRTKSTTVIALMTSLAKALMCAPRSRTTRSSKNVALKRVAPSVRRHAFESVQHIQHIQHHLVNAILENSSRSIQIMKPIAVARRWHVQHAFVNAS